MCAKFIQTKKMPGVSSQMNYFKKDYYKTKSVHNKVWWEFYLRLSITVTLIIKKTSIACTCN